MPDKELAAIRERTGPGVAADLRLLADMIDANPMLGGMLKTGLRELVVFPHHFSVDAESVEELLATRAEVVFEEEKSHRKVGTFEVRRAMFPEGGVAVRVYRKTSEAVA